MEKVRNNRKQRQRQGTVISNKMNKTIIVSEMKKVKHKNYGKSIIKNKIYMVHDENNISKNGDMVSIVETRPLSRRKHWKLITILKKYK
ncbi:30S ribosomal protein S17 [Blattabacterium cuenoti]|uniref:30S ribosomal protein S17 n=1 Tax=Blattabacterium cuenoti TaxID=1653831 RepID=UPI00163CD243|nr:30S ribosomal protein S17 [Blattabacterium cuenoti]